MGTLINRIRSGAGKAAFEADKVRRIQAIQFKIRSLNQEAEKGYSEVGRVAFALYQKEQVNQLELKAVCDRQAAVLAQIAAHQQEIEGIRAEVYVDTAVAMQYGHICPNGHGQIPPQDNFCQICGAKAIDVPPPSGLTCPHCQAALQPGAHFCLNCGQVVSAPTASEPVGDTCPNCGASLLPDAAFCTECGYKIILPGPEPVLQAAVDVETAVPESLLPEVQIDEPGEEMATELEMPITDAAAELEELSSEMATTCPACNAPLVENAAFCTECGHRIN